jgi:hypothetical protein
VVIEPLSRAAKALRDRGCACLAVDLLPKLEIENADRQKRLGRERGGKPTDTLPANLREGSKPDREGASGLGIGGRLVDGAGAAHVVGRRNPRVSRGSVKGERGDSNPRPPGP